MGAEGVSRDVIQVRVCKCFQSRFKKICVDKIHRELGNARSIPDFTASNFDVSLLYAFMLIKIVFGSVKALSAYSPNSLP
jgi:hypothetical protein